MDAQGILDSIKGVKNKDKDKYAVEKSTGVITCTLIGAGLGLMIAYNRKGSLLMGAVIGGAITGLGGNYFITKKKK